MSGTRPTPLAPTQSALPEIRFTPVPLARRRKLTARRQRQFIEALARTGLVSEAAEEVGVSVAALEKLRYSEAGQRAVRGLSFRAAWDAARGCEAARKARAERRRGGLGLAGLGLAGRDAARRMAGDERAGSRDDMRAGSGGPAHGTSHGASHVGPGAFRLSCGSANPSQRTSRAAFTGPEPSPDDPLLGFRPFLHPCPRRNSITPDRQRAFIAALAASGSVRQAARAIGASMEALYNLRARGGAEEFAAAWEKAIDLGIARLEDTALARAIEGELRPIVARGEIIGEYRVHNEALVMFLLRHRRAARYGPPAERAAPPERSEREIIDSINAKLDRARDQMRLREARRVD
ncbi:hypothetical protein [Croceicoccus marinus]|uniref:hypothetical protein n=1 Tax=Croceicoccus marinus TaxID=450378 RepID=UPI000AB8BC6D|nr:hypothetical protein [Croceicoccus marinus]